MSDLRRSQWLDLATLDLRKGALGGPRRRWPIAVALLAIAWAVPFLGWYLVPRAAAGVVILDKTVPRDDRREHLRLMWWLTHSRVPTADGSWWDATRDYVGYDPEQRQGRLLEARTLEHARLAYLADAYGVYTADLPVDGAAPTGPAALARSTPIFAGVTLPEAQALAAFRERGGAVVAEFNVLESPTAGTPAAAVLERLLGAHYTGWLARSYDDLASDDEIPAWMRTKWQRRHRTPWNFRGPGTVLFGEADDRIAVILREQVEGRHAMTLEVDRPLDPLMRGVEGGAGYGYWVSGIEPTDSGVTVASFQLHVDSAARAQLAHEGFALRFPAIVRRTTGPRAAYIAADLADAASVPPYVQRTVWLDAWRAHRVRDAVGAEGDLDFFWRVIAPVWDATLRLASPTAR
ncbi:MAG: hypothetical protein HY275_07970 [Gemmatimonadetes bacterium]|nr:hypothetical protein [Gemmatimonadota bacterium]